MSHPWMPFYVGDYLGKTQRLNATEHGAYLLLIMEYWQSGGLPTDDSQLARICRLTVKEWQRVRTTVAAYFHNGWQHHRIDEELAKANGKHDRRVEAGKRGGIAKAALQQTPSIALASSSEPEPEKISLPSEAPPNKPDDDVRDAVGIYNQAAGRVGWPLAQRVTGARRSACLLRLGECGGIDGWRAAIERAEGSGFLRGDNDKGWRAGLDFFLQSKSFTKLMEGSYDDHAGSSASNGKRPHDAILGALADIASEGIGPREWQADPDERPSSITGPAPGDRPQDSDLDIPAYLRRTA